MFTTFLLNRFKHLRQFYKTEKQFTDHLLSGEVTMTIPDVIQAYEEYHNPLLLPSQHQIQDEVQMKFDSLYTRGHVIAVHFYPGKVKYDLELILNEEHTTRVYNIDSVFVEKFKVTEAINEQ